MNLFVACAPGLEPLLVTEIGALGAEATEVPGGAELEGDLDRVMRLNLELGLGTHVLARVGAFRARSLGELARKAGRLPWEQFLLGDRPVAVRARARASRLYHTGAIAQRVLEGIAARLGSEVIDGREAAAPIAVRVHHDECTLSLDTSGEPLHRRGYRLRGGPAPLREDLARALLRASGWDPATPLVDPFCGTGTIPIEAALLARQLAPGRHRRFAFEGTRLFDAARWEAVRAAADARALAAAPAPIHASDRDASAVEATRENAERAGVLGDLRVARAPLGRAPFREADLPERGALVTDPPHGRRMGRRGDLDRLYRALGDVARALPGGWRVALAASDRRLALKSGLELSSALLTDAGGTKLRFLTR